MSDFPSVPPQDRTPSDAVGRPSLLRIWFGVRDEVTRGVYAWSGLGLMLFKYAVEAGVIFLFTQHLLTPWVFLNPLLTSRAACCNPAPNRFGQILVQPLRGRVPAAFSCLNR